MERRAEKWAAKLSGETRKRAYDSQKKRMSELEAEATKELVKIEEQVKKIAGGASTIKLPYYIIFAKEIYSKARAHAAGTLIDEIEILQGKWIKRGLDWTILDKIKTMYVQEYKAGYPFTLDHSLLDGNDRLV